MIVTDISTVSGAAAGAAVGVVVGLIASLAVYVWLALALSAVFRKAGQEGWQAWVPILNLIVLLRIAAFPAWYVLAFLIPVLGQIVFIVAVYRVNRGFGQGVGMTVLGVLLFPIWATVVGFGPARWVGSAAGSAAGSAVPQTGPRRSADPAVAVPPASPALPGAGGAPAAAFPGFAPVAPPPGFGEAHAGGYVPAVAAGSSAAPAPSDASAADWAPPAPADFTPHPTPSAPAPAPAPAVADAPPLVTGVPGIADAPAPAPAAGRPSWGEPAPLPSGRPAEWGGFDLGAVGELTSEVTGAIAGAPAPVSAVPAAPAPAPLPVPAPAPARSVPDAEPAASAAPPAVAADESAHSDTAAPAVTRVPAAAPQPATDEPWAPARSPLSDPEAFPEASGPISAIVGAPHAGAPRSARTSVSAQHAQSELPDDDDLDQTVIARRRRTAWSIVPPGADPVALSADVVILGRRPSADAAFPGAQLVAIDDGTVSKTHARLVLRDDVWWVTDLGSTNGVLFATFMGTEVEATPGVEVQAGDRFLLGDAEVRLVRTDA